MGVQVSTSLDVATVTMNWPETRNALDLDRISALTAAITDATATANVVVLTGNGAFCAGANLSSVVSSSRTAAQRQGDIEAVPQSLIKTIVDAPVPVFAAIDGPAIGLGFDLALACDARFLGPDGWCMQGWARIGVIAATGGVLMLAEHNPTLLWTLLADQPRITGPMAEQWGIGESVGSGTALEAATSRAASVAGLPVKAVRAYKQLSRGSLKRHLEDHLRTCAALQASLLADPGVPERVARLLRDRKQSVTDA